MAHLSNSKAERQNKKKHESLPSPNIKKEKELSDLREIEKHVSLELSSLSQESDSKSRSSLRNTLKKRLFSPRSDQKSSKPNSLVWKKTSMVIDDKSVRTESIRVTDSKEDWSRKTFMIENGLEELPEWLKIDGDQLKWVKEDIVSLKIDKEMACPDALEHLKIDKLVDQLDQELWEQRIDSVLESYDSHFVRASSVLMVSSEKSLLPRLNSMEKSLDGGKLDIFCKNIKCWEAVGGDSFSLEEVRFNTVILQKENFLLREVQFPRVCDNGEVLYHSFLAKMIENSTSEQRHYYRMKCQQHISLEHDNIRTHYGIGSRRKRKEFFLLKEYYQDNRTLSTFSQTQPMNDQVIHQIFTQLVEVLRFLQLDRGLHAGLDPEKIFLSKYGSVKISSVPLSGKKRKLLGEKVRYLSPEVACGGLHDFRFDIWVFGCILAQCSTGLLPWADVPLDYVKGILDSGKGLPYDLSLFSETVKEILTSCWKQPNERITIVGLLRLPWAQTSPKGKMNHIIEYLEQINTTYQSEAKQEEETLPHQSLHLSLPEDLSDMTLLMDRIR